MTVLRERVLVSPEAMPTLPRHVRIQYDPVRQAFAVLAPENVFWPNEIGLEILRHCDGRSPVAAIVAGLARDYDAPEEAVAVDVTVFLQEWSDKRLVRL